MQLFIVIVTILITTIVTEVINLDYVASISGNKPTQKATQENRRKAWVHFH